MSAPSIVWLVVGLTATALSAILVVALVRQSILVGRTALRLAREVSEVAEGMGSVGEGRRGRR